MSEYISREELLSLYEDKFINPEQWSVPLSVVIQNIHDVPAADVVPRSAYEQAVWERDTAIAQLSEIGKGLGAKMDDVAPVVRCLDCAVPHNRWTGCPKLGGLIPTPDFYCAFGERRC